MSFYRYMTLFYLIVLTIILIVTFNLGFSIGIVFLFAGLIPFVVWWIFVGRNLWKE